MTTSTTPRDQGEPREVLAEALRDELHRVMCGNAKHRTTGMCVVMAPNMARGFSERGYTIVASDRLAGLEEALNRLHGAAAALRAEWPGLGHGDDCEPETCYVSRALSRSEATEKGAPRE